MDKKEISELYRNIVNSIDYDDITFKEQEGTWYSAISVQMKSVMRYVENFKGANPYSVIKSWNNQVFDYLKSNNPYKISLKGNVVTAVFNTPTVGDIDSVVYYAAYICSLLEMFNCALERKGIRTFDIGIGISTINSHVETIENDKYPIFCESVDLISLCLALEANNKGFERIVLDDCTQFNLSDKICFGDKKYSEVGIKRSSVMIGEDVYGYNLNLSDITAWIDKHKNDKQD